LALELLEEMIMKKLCRIEILLLMLFMALLSVHSAMGKDVSDEKRLMESRMH